MWQLQFSKRTTLFILGGIILLGFVLRMLNATTSNIWGDEMLGFVAARGWDGQPLAANPDAVPAGTFSPVDFQKLDTLANVVKGTNVHDNGKSFFYYVTLHYWMQLFGTGDFSIRMLSVLLGTLSIPLGWLLVSRLPLPRAHLTSLVTALMLALNPMHYWASTEARPYSLALLLSLAGTILFLEALRRENSGKTAWGWWLGYGLTMGLSILSHYLSGYIVLGHGLYALFTLRRLGPWIRYATGLALIAALLGIWLSMGAREAGNEIANMNQLYLERAKANFPMPNLKLTTPGSLAKQNYDLLTKLWNIHPLPAPLFPFWTKYAMLALCVVFYSVLATQAFRQLNASSRTTYWFILGLAFAGPICATLLSIKAGHTFSFQPKYATFTIPYAVIFLAIIATHLPKHPGWMVKTGIVLVAVQTLICGIVVGGDRQIFPTWSNTFQYGWPRESTEEIQASARQVAKDYRPGDSVVYSDWFAACYASLYLPPLDTMRQRVVPNSDPKAPRVLLLRGDNSSATSLK